VKRATRRSRRTDRFTGRRAAFTWKGRPIGGRRLGDGYYFARFTVPTARGGADVRRVTLRRSRGRFSVRPAFHARSSCGRLREFKLSAPVFGGRGRRPLGVAYRLDAAAQVSFTVLRGSRVIERVASRTQPGGRILRLRVGRAARRRGDYRVRITVRREGRAESSTLVARRL